MRPFRRYAVYWTPAPETPLARFGAAWLGWDVATGAPASRLATSLDLPAITKDPSKYGFHGTVKPPFRTDADPAMIADAAEAVADAAAPVVAPPLRLARLGGFLALIPSAHDEALAALAFRFVEGLDPFRIAPGEAELARRRAAGLSERQEEMLAQWGYPYVGPEFRFHLTLSGRLDPATADAVEAALAPEVAAFTAAPLEIRDVTLCGEIDGGSHDGRFAAIRRIPLRG